LGKHVNVGGLKIESRHPITAGMMPAAVLNFGDPGRREAAIFIDVGGLSYQV
jgi:hypothetical protein